MSRRVAGETPDRRHLCVSNYSDNNVSAYDVGKDGSLSLLPRRSGSSASTATELDVKTPSSPTAAPRRRRRSASA